MYITLLKIRTLLNKKDSRHENKVSLKKNKEQKFKKKFLSTKTLRNLSDFLGMVSHINIPVFVLAFLLPSHIFYQDNENSNCIVKVIIIIIINNKKNNSYPLFFY